MKKSMDSYVAAAVASGITPGDGVNAFCSMKRAAMQRGVLKFEPKLLPSFDFLYGPDATGSCYFYGAGELRPLGSCRMTDGVAQGDGFGPLFFSLGHNTFKCAFNTTRTQERRDMRGQCEEVVVPVLRAVAVALATHAHSPFARSP